MNQVMQRTLSASLLVLFALDQAIPGSPATVPAVQATKPTGTGILALTDGGECATTGNFLIVKPFGIGTDGQTYNITLIGWTRACDNNGKEQWTATLLADLTVTLGAALGTSNGLTTGSAPFKSTHSVAKTIVINSGLRATLTPAGTNPASQEVQLDPSGCQLIQAVVGSGGNASDANLAVRQL